MEKLVPAIPSALLALVAIGISVYTVFYNKNKDARARQQSIQDDFWLRKIISPISIEPFLKHVADTSHNLPKHDATVAEVQKFWTDSLKKSDEFSTAFLALRLLDTRLCIAVQKAFVDEFEDIIAAYCGTLSAFADGKASHPPSNREAAASIMEIGLSICEQIKNHQSQVGGAAAR